MVTYFIIVDNLTGNALYDSWANVMKFETYGDAEVYIADNDMEDVHIEAYEDF